MNWVLDHVQVAIPQGAEGLCDAFYCDLLGFEILEKPTRLAVRGGRWYRAGACEVHVGVEVDFRPAKKAHPGLTTDAYDEVLARLRRAGVDVVENDEIPGVRRCHVADPVGNRLEISERR
jgi:catechol 2,3-dioxygenase-like lactoylglutathione lyase family enzyme